MKPNRLLRDFSFNKVDSFNYRQCFIQIDRGAKLTLRKTIYICQNGMIQQAYKIFLRTPERSAKRYVFYFVCILCANTRWKSFARHSGWYVWFLAHANVNHAICFLDRRVFRSAQCIWSTKQNDDSSGFGAAYNLSCSPLFVARRSWRHARVIFLSAKRAAVPPARFPLSSYVHVTGGL